MKRRLILTGVLIVGWALSGCVPRKLFWSPDGKRVAVLGTEGLYLGDAEGNLSKMIAPHVSLVAWAPDSRRFLAAGLEEVKRFSALEPVLTREQKSRLIGLHEKLRSEILGYQGDWKDFSSSVQHALTGGEFMALLLYTLEHDDGKLAGKLGDQWKEAQKASALVCRLTLYEVADGQAKAGPVLASWVDGVADLRVSPNGEWVAITLPTAPSSDHGLGRLLVMPTGGGAQTLVADHVAAYSDWSPDGRSLYYGTTTSPQTSKDQSFTLGTLTRRQVIDPEGRLLSTLPEPEDIVGLMFWYEMKVRCLKDGRVLFSSGEVTLPSTKADMPQSPSLFFIDPARQPTVSRILPKEADGRLEGLGLGQFELSPDEQRVVVLGSGSKEVSVITLATGQITTIVAPKTGADDERVGCVPVWRSADELSVLVGSKTEGALPDRASVMVYTLEGKGRVLNRNWPDIFAAPTEK
ncbi:MAG: hypothetical protein HRF43_06915 [Phycisphaerae bacterium]|jgi:hypothetical protein